MKTGGRETWLGGRRPERDRAEGVLYLRSGEKVDFLERRGDIAIHSLVCTEGKELSWEYAGGESWE